MKATKATILLPLLLVAFASFGQGILKINKFTRNNGNYLQLDTTRNDTWANMATEGYVHSYVAQFGGGGGGQSYTSTNGITQTLNNFSLGGALANNTTITGSAYTFNFGAVGNRMSGFNAYTANGLLLQDGPVSGTFPYLNLLSGNAILYGRNTDITGLLNLTLTGGASSSMTGALVSFSASDSMKFAGTGITASTDTTLKPLWISSTGRAYRGNHGSWTTSVFGRTGAVTAQSGDYSAFYPSLSGSYANPSWITSLAVAKITWSGTSSQQVLGDGSLATKITNNNQLTNGAGYLTNITGYISAGSNVSITGSGTSGSPYVINASGGSGGTYTFTNGLTESGSVARWGGRLTANTSISGANLYQVAFDSVTKFGIGTASPDAKLHVNGAAGLGPQNFPVGLEISQPDNGSHALIFTNGTNANSYLNMYLGNGGDFWIESHDLSTGRNLEVVLDATANQFVVNTAANGYIGLDAQNTGYVHIQGRLGMKTVNPTAIVHLPAGTATANTAPLKFTTGTALATPEDGAMEYHAGHLYMTIGSTRYQLDQQGGGTDSVGNWQQVTDNGNTTTNMLIANGTIGSGAIFDNTPYSASPLMLWYPRKGAFRAGRSSSFWRADSIGNYSVAFGQNTKAKGSYSLASGDGPIATGVAAVAFGRTTFATGDYSFVAGGSNSLATGIGAVAAGTDGEAFGNYSFIANDANYSYGTSSSAFGFGNNVYATDGFAMGTDNLIGALSGSGTANQYTSSIAIGTGNRTVGNRTIAIGRVAAATNTDAIIIGTGLDNGSTRITNSEAQSFAVGFNSNVPTFMVHKAAGSGTYGLTEAYGAFKLGTTSTLANGTLRYTGTDFEGAVGGSWVSLTTPTAANLPSTIVYNNQANTFNNNTIEGYSAKYNDQTGTTYTILSGDNGKILTFDNASGITVTVPSGLPIGFNCMILQKGAGQVTLVASSTTINNRQSYTKTAGQYAMATLVSFSSNVFISSGDMSN